MKFVHSQTAIFANQPFGLSTNSSVTIDVLPFLNICSTVFKFPTPPSYFITCHHIAVNTNNFAMDVGGRFVFSNRMRARSSHLARSGIAGYIHVKIRVWRNQSNYWPPPRLVLFACTTLSRRSANFETKNFPRSYRYVITLLSEHTSHIQKSFSVKGQAFDVMYITKLLTSVVKCTNKNYRRTDSFQSKYEDVYTVAILFICVYALPY